MAGSFSPSSQCWSVLRTIIATAAIQVLALGIEVEVKPHTEGSLFSVALDVGSPPQRIWAGLDTASQWLWFPESVSGSPGFHLADSSSAVLGEAKRIEFADGLTVNGSVLMDNVVFGGVQADSMPMILASNFSGERKPPSGGLGLLGLMVPRKKVVGWFSGPDDDEKELEEGSFLGHFWKVHNEVPRTLQFDLGGARPRLRIGEESGASSQLRRPGEVKLLSDFFTAMGDQWYVSVRAIGLSTGKDSPSIQTNLDFNSAYSFGAPALLDSGSSAIRVGSGVWKRLLEGLPAGCKREDSGGIGCPCTATSLQDDFPTISISFEALDTVRVLGLDSGADTIICIPPSAYVLYRTDRNEWCSLAIIDGGANHQMFGYEAVVLGVPFFKSASILFDVDKGVVGVAPLLTTSFSATEAVGLESSCKCADPKNWWATGHRLSPKRVVVVLLLTSMIAAYIFISYSQTRTAEQLRGMVEGLIGTSSVAGAGQSLGGGAGQSQRPQNQFVQMAERAPPE